MPISRIVLYVASIAAFALIARSLILGPIPVWVAGSAMIAYVGLVTSGTMILRMQMFVDAIIRAPQGSRGVALTFDDGPDPEHTPKVLDLLDDYDAKATFFVIGKKAKRHPELVREIIKRGHSVGVHGFVHDRMFCFRSIGFVRNDLKKAMATLEEITGERPVLFRPPVGLTSSRIAKVVKELKLEVVGWSLRGRDGVGSAKPEHIEKRVIAGIKDGEIVLLHDAAERDDHSPPGVKALPHILDAMKSRGLVSVPVLEWMNG